MSGKSCIRVRGSLWVALLVLSLPFLQVGPTLANPWNGKVVLQGFWWDAWNANYPYDWYTFLAKLSPRLRAMGIDGIWIPSPSKADSGENSTGYDIFDHYDLGDKLQKSRVGTRFGTKDSLLRFIAVAHSNGLEIYPDIVLNHTSGGQEDPQALGRDKYKRFRYVGFAGPEAGRWPKDHWNFHPNPDHYCEWDDRCKQDFGPDNCFLDQDHHGGGNGKYMRDHAREWFVWLAKQTGADGFRFDAVKHFPPYVVEDLLYNAMGNRLDYFAVGEYVEYRKDILDGWADSTMNRSGTFDFALHEALSSLVEAGGFFDMGQLPNHQQNNRQKTSPFVNNHDTWRGAFWDSKPGSSHHDDRDGDWRRNERELAPTIDPDNPRTDVTYAAAFAVDGSPTVYYEDLFVNYGPDRNAADPKTIAARPYVTNLIWAHQKLDFKEGAYRVRHQGSQDLLIIERSGKAIIGLNDHGNEWQSAWVETDFGPKVKLHDYSGAVARDLKTDNNGWVNVSVPPMGYVILGPSGIKGGFSPRPRRTVQEFQLADDLGDASPQSLGYGGNISSEDFRTAGSVWAAQGTRVKIWVFTDGERNVILQVHAPDDQGNKSHSSGVNTIEGHTSNDTSIVLEFDASREGYHQLCARLTDAAQEPTRAYIKVEYEAPAESIKF
jgi:alpha-amylase